MPTRDIPFDEEYPDRPDAAREAFADIAPLADLEARRRKIAEDMDRRAGAADAAASQTYGFDLDPDPSRHLHPRSPSEAHIRQLRRSMPPRVV